MNTALRIAAVTFILRDLLNKGLTEYNSTDATGVGVNVTASSPDKIDTSLSGEPSQLNLFMYQATPNVGWRNVGFPSLNSGGERISNPPLAIDLHYILSAYGSQELHTDILLGYGMQILHENPVLDRGTINKFLTEPGLSAQLKTLADSNLADQAEMIKITPELLSIEDISKLWTAFTTKYRPTAAYLVTVVLIESDRSTKSGPPVKTRNIYTVPFKIPVIEKVLSQSAIDQSIADDRKILIDDSLILRGNSLFDVNAQVLLDGITVANNPANKLIITDTQISFSLANINLPAGTHQITITHLTPMGTDPKNAPTHPGTTSAPATFTLSPKITDINHTAISNAITIPATGQKNVTITVSPQLFPGQKIALLLNATTADVTNNFPSYSYQTALPGLNSDPAAVPVNDIMLPVGEIEKGVYLVRIQVDGVDSPLISDTNGVYSGPQITAV